ncbi:MAG: hypothetical protein Q7U10_00590 [Thermodesulfovibrionia bacterium]|nr:hypothetical protein [Thermodesulfovibrionia bacterium]
MKTIAEKFEQIFSAAAFAESGEHETARLIMKECAPAEIKSRKQAAADSILIQSVKAN